jgi:hypothetical protein
VSGVFLENSRAYHGVLRVDSSPKYFAMRLTQFSALNESSIEHCLEDIQSGSSLDVIHQFDPALRSLNRPAVTAEAFSDGPCCQKTPDPFSLARPVKRESVADIPLNQLIDKPGLQKSHRRCSLSEDSPPFRREGSKANLDDFRGPSGIIIRAWKRTTLHHKAGGKAASILCRFIQKRREKNRDMI